MTPDIAYNTPFIQMIAFMLILLTGLVITLLGDPYIRREHKRIILIIIVLVVSLIAQNYVEYILEKGTPRPLLRTIVAIYGYSVRPMLIVLFYYIISKRNKRWPSWLLIGANTVVYMTALFSGIAFKISEENHFLRGPLGYCCHLVTGILLANFLCLTIREYGLVNKRQSWIPAFNTVVIIASVVLDSTLLGKEEYPVTALTLAVVSSCLLYYMWLHLQFVREHEQGLKAEQRIQIMMSQIQPHFLYNTLSTIQALCRTDPEQAFTTTQKFGMYLRQNLDSLSQPMLISVRKELEHTQVYTDIEKIRFPGIHVEYRIEDDSFSLPALTIQPLVENAIRHGVRIREKGLVTVCTRRNEDYHEVVITDNGKGFDGKAVEQADGEPHIGIRNVRERIEKMCGGTLIIDSRIGEGTTVTIRLPS